MRLVGGCHRGVTGRYDGLFQLRLVVFGKMDSLCGLAFMPAEHGGHERTLDTGAKGPTINALFLHF